MVKVRIFTDSSADLPAELKHRYQIGVVPLSVTFPDSTHKDGIDLSPHEFYAKMEDSPQLPVTSQPSPQDFIEAFRPALEAGQAIVSINISANLSGTLNSALLAREELGELAEGRVFIIDSLSASMGQGLLVVLAAKLAESGKEPRDIVSEIERLRVKLQSLFTLETMTNLVKGGRISPSKAALGNLLNVKPILSFDSEGRIEAKDKARGRKKSLKYLVDSLVERASTGPEVIAVAHAMSSDEAELVSEEIRGHFPGAEILVGLIGPTIGTHTGKGCMAVFYLKE